MELEEPQKEAFNSIKQLVPEAPVLGFYKPNKPITVAADASSYGIGTVILQEENGTQKPIAFASHTLSQAEQGYTQIEKELLQVCVPVKNLISMSADYTVSDSLRITIHWCH